MEWISVRVPYFIKYLELFDKVCSEYIAHIELMINAIKRGSSIKRFSFIKVRFEP